MTWKALRHPNVLPLLGVMTESRFVMVSEWMRNGNINKFVEANADADRLGLVRFRSGSSYPLATDGRMINVARRCHQGVDAYA